ncbi:hypothetical protein ACJJTC_016398 [Scirpophaga incertulas]
MSMILLVFIATSVASHRVTESIEDIPPEAFFNTTTTTLYPVIKNITNQIVKNVQNNEKRNSDSTIATSESPIQEEVDDKIEKTEAETSKNSSNVKEDFKPSPHLGTIFDENVALPPAKTAVGDFQPSRKPPNSFISSSRDHFKSSFKGIPKNQNEVSHNLDGIITTRSKDSWRPMSLDSKPTFTPGTVPAGGLYKSPDAFKEHPLSISDFDSGFDQEDQKDNHNHLNPRKRGNPWKNLLRLMTAFIPVGLIISALTPNVITVQSTDADTNRYGNLYRRWDPGENSRPGEKLHPGGIAAISEPCRRRLLCELQFDKHFDYNKPKPEKNRSCHRIHCEDLDAVYGTLRWLLARHRNTGRFHHEGYRRYQEKANGNHHDDNGRQTHDRRRQGEDREVHGDDRGRDN